MSKSVGHYQKIIQNTGHCLQEQNIDSSGSLTPHTWDTPVLFIYS